MYTLGPWVAHKDGSVTSDCSLKTIGREVVATVPDPENQRLVAVAPEMLQILRDIHENGGADDDDIERVIGRAEGTRG